MSPRLIGLFFMCNGAGLDEGLLSLSLSNLLYMENPYSYKKFQPRITAHPRISTGRGEREPRTGAGAPVPLSPAHPQRGGEHPPGTPPARGRGLL
jgi:hypothetical protein